jgi:proteasome lid subunit RPN8/RPN11
MADGEPDLNMKLDEGGPGSGGEPAPLVLIRRAVLETVRAHAAEDLNTELGGVLLGTAASSPEGAVVLVEASIRALHTDASRGSITFTHETWDSINQVKDRDYPDKRVVGWYHTHPGFGLFLSEYDLFIHRNFFDLPWQVALVVDPRANTAGVFVWQDGEITGPREAEVVSGPAGTVSGNATVADAVDRQGTPRWRMTVWHWCVAAALALILVAQIALLARTPASPDAPPAPTVRPAVPSKSAGEAPRTVPPGKAGTPANATH